MKVKKHLKSFMIFWIVFGIVLTPIHDTAFAASVLDYLPMKKGNWWEYVDENESKQIRVVTHDEDAIIITTYVDQKPIHANAYGVYQNRIDHIEHRRANGKGIQWTPPITILSPQYDKEQWSYQYSFDENERLEASFPVHIRYERLNVEPIELDLGNVHAHHIRIILKSRFYDEIRDLWFASGVGIVKERIETISHTEGVHQTKEWTMVRFGITDGG